jgi:hypothetical protein
MHFLVELVPAFVLVAGPVLLEHVHRRRLERAVDVLREEGVDLLSYADEERALLVEPAWVVALERDGHPAPLRHEREQQRDDHAAEQQTAPTIEAVSSSVQRGSTTPSRIASPMRPDWLPMLAVEYERVATRQNRSDVTRRSSAGGVDGSRKGDELALRVRDGNRQQRDDDEHHGDRERIGGEHRGREPELAPEPAAAGARAPAAVRRAARASTATTATAPGPRGACGCTVSGIGVVAIRASSLVASGDTIRPARLE